MFPIGLTHFDFVYNLRISRYYFSKTSFRGSLHVNLRRSSHAASDSGEWPFCDVLLRQIVAQISAQSADGHWGHVTGTAVWGTEIWEETGKHFTRGWWSAVPTWSETPCLSAGDDSMMTNWPGSNFSLLLTLPWGCSCSSSSSPMIWDMMFSEETKSNWAIIMIRYGNSNAADTILKYLYLTNVLLI